MEIRIDSGVLTDAVAWAARVLPVRSPMPVLGGLLLEAGEGGGLSVFGLDHEASARVEAEAETVEYVVTGGFAEVSPTAATILAEQAMPREDADSTLVEELMTAAERALADAPPERRMAAGQRVRDVIALKARLSA